MLMCKRGEIMIKRRWESDFSATISSFVLWALVIISSHLDVRAMQRKKKQQCTRHNAKLRIYSIYFWIFSPATAINFIFKTLAINDNVTDRTKSKAFYTRLMLTNSRSSLKTIKHCQQNLTQPTMIRSLVGRVGVRSSKLQQSSINRTEMAIASGEWVKVCKRFIWFYMALAHSLVQCNVEMLRVH